jgi:hypothetical protein
LPKDRVDLPPLPPMETLRKARVFQMGAETQTKIKRIVATNKKNVPTWN